MKIQLRRVFLISTLASLLVGCALLSDIRDLTREAEDWLPLAPIGGTPVQVDVDVDFDYRETIEGAELVASSGAWTHAVEGRLLKTIGWVPHDNQIDNASGNGRIHCHHPAGPEHDWTVTWSSDLSFDGGHWQTAAPLLHLATYGDEVLVLYALPQGFHFWHPGSRDDCQNPEPVKAHLAVGDMYFSLDDVDVDRAPDAETSTQTAVQDGIVMLRIPLNKLSSGTVEANTVNLSGTSHGMYGTVEWSLRITLTLTS